MGRGKGVGRRVEISWAARKKKERKRAGPAEVFWAERGFFFLSFFCKRFKQIQFEFKFKEFKFKLNHNIKTMQG